MALNQKCDPLQNNIDSPSGPPLPGMPGFNVDIPFPTPALPNLGIPEDILNLLRRLKFTLPGGGALQGKIDNLAAKVSEILSGLLGYLNAAMGWLMYIAAIVEMILCIIKVLCAFPKPWSVIRAIKRLLRRCIPLFISIVFPFLAWLLLLLALIAILIALIEYIIAMIKRLIEQILKNLRKLRDLTLKQRSPNAALMIANKIANLLCLFESIFEFLAIVISLFEIIMGKWSDIFKVCDKGQPNPDGTRGPDNDEVCADFLSNPVSSDNDDIEIYKTRMGSEVGTIWYCNPVFGQDLTQPSVFKQLRPETIYLYDSSLSGSLEIKEIISSGGFPFFPFDKTITKDVEYRLKPYLIDLYITCNPNVNDGFGIRKINIKDVTVTYVNTKAVREVVNDVIQEYPVPGGVFSLSGGEVVDDINLALNGQGIEIVLGQWQSPSPKNSDSTLHGGSYIPFTDIEYVLKANYEALAEYNLITLGCFPSVQLEQAILNTEFSKIFNFALSDFVTLPDVSGASEKLLECFSNFRKSITLETTDVFGKCMEDIMNDLLAQSNNTYCQLLQAAIDIYNTEAVLSTDLQFVNTPIVITVTPRDKAGKTLSDLMGGFTPSIDCMNSLASKFRANVTLGEASNFSYDGYGKFLSNLTSLEAGDGSLTLYFDNELIKRTVKPLDPSLAPSIVDFVLDYSFVGIGVSDGYQAAIRRDETDNS